MSSSLPGRRPTVCTALAVLVASLTAALPVGAVIDCCRVGSIPPMVAGFFIPATTAEEAHDQATRLGFKPIWRPGEGEIRAGLDRGFLWWQPGLRTFRSGAIYSTCGYPLVSSASYSLCTPLVVIPDRPEFSVRGARHPNGALAVTGVLAVVPDLDAACAALRDELPRDPRWSPVFEPPEVLAALGAVSRTAVTSDGTTITILSPNDREGHAARWLAASGPRWLGVTVRVEDLDRTAEWLARHGVDFERRVIQGLPHLLVDLSGTGGTMIVFFDGAGLAG